MQSKWAIVVVAFCVVVTAVAVAYAAGKTSAPEVIQAQRFELVDSEGTVLAVLGVSPDGTGLAVLDGKGKFPRVAMGVMKADGTSGLLVWDETGKLRVGVGTEEDNSGGLAVMDNQGSPVWSAP